ncbi:MAG: serine hydrolase domain-containing protein [Acetobacteraceae bacterium]
MLRRRLLSATVAAPVLAVADAVAAPPRDSAPKPRRVRLEETLRPYLNRHDLPALAAAIVQGGAIIAAGAVGTRKAGAAIPVTLNDRFHIGSDTKALTALLAASFVEQGALRWDTTVGDVFSDMLEGMNEGLRRVTLQQLLSHTSGIPSDNDAFGDLLTRSLTQDGLNLNELRVWLVREWRTQPLASPPGTRFAYSNMGYTLAGAMLERVSHTSWEELIVQRVFTPLGLRSAGFGPQSSPGRIDAPLPHRTNDDGTLKPMMAGPNADNPAIIGPAGTVHMSVPDFAAWAGWNAGEGRRPPYLVHRETLRKLHTKVIDAPPKPDSPPGTPSPGGYALGWGVVSVPWADEPLITHSGSNMMNFAMIWLRPSRDFAMVLTTNVGGNKADEALKSLSEALFRRFGGG